MNNLLYCRGRVRVLPDVGPLLWLKILRGRRQKKFGAQFPDALDIIVRSLRAGHPVPVAITMVGRELPDPCGTEFGIVADEVTYGSDLEGAMRNLYFRVGQDDLPLFVTAVAIQGSTGGNLGEILENLSGVIRLRFKMRRKVRALAAEGRASAMILASLPIAMFGIINLVAPDFYSSVWHHDMTKIALVDGRRLDERRRLHHVSHGQFQDLNMDTDFSFFGDSASTMLTLMIFLATTVLAFAIMAMVRVHGAVKRRTAGINAKLAAHADFSGAAAGRQALQGREQASSIMLKSITVRPTART